MRGEIGGGEKINMGRTRRKKIAEEAVFGAGHDLRRRTERRKRRKGVKKKKCFRNLGSAQDST